MNMRMRVPEGKQYQIKGRTYKSGEEFDAPEKEAMLWKAAGLAIEAAESDVEHETEPELTNTYSTESMAPELPKRRGPGRPSKAELAARYDRKDMRAEDE